MLSSFAIVIWMFFTGLATKILTSVNATSSVAVIGARDDFPAAIEGIVMITFPLAVATLTPAAVVVVVAAEDDVVVSVVVVVVVVAQLLHVTDVENALAVSPNCKLIVADELVPPTVMVHERVVDEPAAMVVAELDVGSPLHVNPLGHDNV